MIIVRDVFKRYQTAHGPGPWVLRGIDLQIPPRTGVALIGANGAGKSTLLRLIGGTDEPTRGSIERQGRVSWPMSGNGGLQRQLSGRQNAKFVCRIHGYESDLPERIARVEEFARLGPSFDEPVGNYSSGMRSKLQFGLSLAFDFDLYISDEVTAAVDLAFRRRTAKAFANLTDRAGLIMVSHDEDQLQELCTAGILLTRGRAQWFDLIDDALAAYRENLTA